MVCGNDLGKRRKNHSLNKGGSPKKEEWRKRFGRDFPSFWKGKSERWERYFRVARFF